MVSNKDEIPEMPKDELIKQGFSEIKDGVWLFEGHGTKYFVDYRGCSNGERPDFYSRSNGYYNEMYKSCNQVQQVKAIYDSKGTKPLSRYS